MRAAAWRTAVPLLALAIVQCREAPAIRRWTAMDCNLALTLYGGDAPPADSLFDRAVRETARLEALFSDFMAGSALSAVQGAAGDTVRIDPEMRHVLARALEMGEASGGAFDITLHDLKALWGIGSGRSPRVPDSLEIDSVMRPNPVFGASPGSPAPPPLSLIGGDLAVIRRGQTPLDLGGIAKGYVVDRLHALLDSLGCPVHLIQAGGEIRTGGRKPGLPWRVGIRHPRIADSVCGVVTSEEPLSVSTSGDYERYFIQDGMRYHHLFDPRTGRPARMACAVTVVGESGILTDALTKPLFILGPEAGAALARRFGAKAVWFLEKEGGICAAPMDELAGLLALRDMPRCGGGPAASGSPAAAGGPAAGGHHAAGGT